MRDLPCKHRHPRTHDPCLSSYGRHRIPSRGDQSFDLEWLSTTAQVSGPGITRGGRNWRKGKMGQCLLVNNARCKKLCDPPEDRKPYLRIDVFYAQEDQAGLGEFPPIPQSGHCPMSLTMLHRNEGDRETRRCTLSVALTVHVDHPSLYDRKYDWQVRVIQEGIRC